MDAMASTLSLLSEAVVVKERGLNRPLGVAVVRTPQQNAIMQVLGITFATISVLSSLLTFYWFLKMRRSFRHDLVMLLIQTDMFKALFFLIFPIVTLIHGRPLSNSAFCQANGFLLLMGIEASDLAVLIIAIHTALSIFRPGSAGEGGLYPYRKFAYAICIFLPIILASLAFINPDGAFISTGTFCYLPVRPFWYRLSLMWIPRYLIFIIIIGIYASIYLYVGHKFAAFTSQSRESTTDTTFGGSTFEMEPSRIFDLPPPPLAFQGPNPALSREPVDEEVMQKHQQAETLRPKSFARRGSVHQFMILASFTSRPDPTIPTIHSDESIAESSLESRRYPTRRSSQHVNIPPMDTMYSEPVSPMGSRKYSWQSESVNRADLEAGGDTTGEVFSDNMCDDLGHRNGPNDFEPNQQLQHHESRPECNSDQEILRTRDKIQKQLRYMFIYPLVYMGMWVIPFVSHVFQYNDNYARNPPFVLGCFATVSICAQAAVDAWLFSSREKPWRHIPNTDGGFWESLKFWTGWEGFMRRKVVKGVGKSRDEMVKEARSAYERRDAEMVQQRTDANAEASANHLHGSESPKRKEKSWWDVEGSFGGALMSPATETTNPWEGRRMSRSAVMYYAKQLSRRGTVDSGPSSGAITLRNSYVGRPTDVGQDEVTRINERRGDSAGALELEKKDVNKETRDP